MKVWIYIILAAILQVFWGLTVKRLNFSKILDYISHQQFGNPILYQELIPLSLYFLLGLANVILISRAYKLMPMSQVYALWMGLTLIFQTMVDVLYFHDNIQFVHMFFIGLILVGIVGLKRFETKLE